MREKQKQERKRGRERSNPPRRESRRINTVVGRADIVGPRLKWQQESRGRGETGEKTAAKNKVRRGGIRERRGGGKRESRERRVASSSEPENKHVRRSCVD